MSTLPYESSRDNIKGNILTLKRTMLKKLIASIICIGLTTAAHADKWLYLDRHYGTDIYANIDSVKNNGDELGLWLGYVHPQGAKLDFEMVYTKIRCSEFQFKPEDSYEYKDWKEVSEWHSKVLQWRRPAPSSGMETAIAMVCTNVKPSTDAIDDNGDPLKFAMNERKNMKMSAKEFIRILDQEKAERDKLKQNK